MKEILILLCFPIFSLCQSVDLINNNKNQIFTHNKILFIGENPNLNKYKLQSKKLWIKWNISITELEFNSLGQFYLSYEHPITREIYRTSIREENIQKILSESKENKKEIIVKNIAGKEFFLVKVE